MRNKKRFKPKSKKVTTKKRNRSLERALNCTTPSVANTPATPTPNRIINDDDDDIVSVAIRTPLDNSILNLIPPEQQPTINPKAGYTIRTWDEQNELKTSVSFIYKQKYHQLYMNNNLPLSDGTANGIVCRILKDTGFTNSFYSTFKHIITQTQIALRSNVLFSPIRKKRSRENKRKIQANSVNMHILASMKAKGASFQVMHIVFNAIERAPSNLAPIGTKAIYNAIRKSNCIKKRQ